MAVEGLKIRRGLSPRGGSTPPPGTTNIKHLRRDLNFLLPAKIPQRECFVNVLKKPAAVHWRYTHQSNPPGEEEEVCSWLLWLSILPRSEETLGSDHSESRPASPEPGSRLPELSGPTGRTPASQRIDCERRTAAAKGYVGPHRRRARARGVAVDWPICACFGVLFLSCRSLSWHRKQSEPGILGVGCRASLVDCGQNDVAGAAEVATEWVSAPPAIPKFDSCDRKWIAAD